MRLGSVKASVGQQEWFTSRHKGKQNILDYDIDSRQRTRGIVLLPDAGVEGGASYGKVDMIDRPSHEPALQTEGMTTADRVRVA